MVQKKQCLMLIPKSGKPGLLRSRRPGIPSVFALRFAVQTHAPGDDDTKNDDISIMMKCLFVCFCVTNSHPPDLSARGAKRDAH